MDTLINPERPTGATHVHGIDDADVQNAPTFDTISGDVLAITEGSIVVAHCYPFEERFLRAEFGRAGLALPGWGSICTVELSRLLEPHERCHKLGAICERRSLPMPTHRAMDDVHSTSLLLVELLAEAVASGRSQLQQIGCTSPTSVDWPSVKPSGVLRPRPDQLHYEVVETKVRTSPETVAPSRHFPQRLFNFGDLQNRVASPIEGGDQ